VTERGPTAAIAAPRHRTSYTFNIVDASVSGYDEGVTRRAALLSRRSRPDLAQRARTRPMGQVAWEKRPHALVSCAICECWSAPAPSRVLSVEAMAAAEALSSGVDSRRIPRSARHSRTSGHLSRPRDRVQTRIACRTAGSAEMSPYANTARTNNRLLDLPHSWQHG
jgi:hypothetical protein